MSENVAKLVAFVRQHGRAAALEILINFALPYAIYTLMEKSYGDVTALMASSLPPILWSIVEFLRHRRVDAVSILVLLGIVLSLLAFVGGGSVRLLQMREKFVTIIIGVIFVGSAAIGRPLIYELARASMKRKASSELESFEALRENKAFRRSMTLMTLVWGFGLLADAAVSILLIYTQPIREYLVAGPALGYATMGGLALWTFLYVRHKKRKRAAVEAAQVQNAG